ncbi:hypothetical protein AAFF_G00241130 [Aldrovandia affinis]|uniref:Uncharacterized protein n=1 Tax=Aldrovandia affinis TaxID=143900 RepID=A0AAD7WTX1_9TELE|nr:hypothetical protein AAFF_G00241130 [Aldrovandia affinis]
MEEKAAQIQREPEGKTTQILGGTVSEIQYDLALNDTPTRHEIEEVQRVPSLSPESFVFHKVLGKGAFGKVMLAELKESGKYFAVKSLKKDSILSNCHVECAKVEKRVLALATENPFLTHLHSTFQTKTTVTPIPLTHLYSFQTKITHLVLMYQYPTFYTKVLALPLTHLYSIFQTKDSLFYVMEYVSGRDLYFYIVVKGHFDLHSTQDLKLNNVMLDGEGHIKIVDFGLCKDNLLDGKAMSFCGTEHYIAPEIFQRKEYSFPVDWWSLGVLVFEMLTGDSPFQGENDDELSMSVCRDTPEYPTSINQESKDLLEKLLERDATNRLGVAGDIRAHPFFDAIDWPALERKEVEPPFKPKMGDPDDSSQLYQEFLSKASHLTDSDSGSVHPDDQLAFAGFSFINPKWSS